MSIISYELRLCSLCFCDYFVTTWQLHDTDNKKFICADSESLALLRQLQSDVEPIVAQSCEVALSMLDFEQNGKSFEVSCCKPCSKYLHVHMNIVQIFALQYLAFTYDSAYLNCSICIWRTQMVISNYWTSHSKISAIRGFEIYVKILITFYPQILSSKGLN